MVGLILLLSYPLFLLLATGFMARNRAAATSLRSMARWLLAIVLAYAATTGLTFVAFFFAGNIYGQFANEFGYMGSLYWIQFWSETVGLAVALLIISVILLALDWLRRRNRTGQAAEASDESTRRTTRVFTFTFLITLILAALLLLEPFQDYVLHHQQVYATTHNRGLDPRDWFPFSWEWPGIFLYELAFWVWSFVAFFLMPLVLAQIFSLRRIWRKLQRLERMAHTGFAAIAALLSIFMLTFGGYILYWLAD